MSAICLRNNEVGDFTETEISHCVNALHVIIVDGRAGMDSLGVRRGAHPPSLGQRGCKGAAIFHE